LGGVLQHVAAAMPHAQREHTRIEGDALQLVAAVAPQLQHVAAVAPQHRLEQGQAQCGLAHVQALDRLAELAPQPAAAAPQHVARIAPHVAGVAPQLQHVAGVAPQPAAAAPQHVAGVAPQHRRAEAPQHVAGVAPQHRRAEVAPQHCSALPDKTRNENDASACVLQQAVAAPLERLAFAQEDSSQDISDDEIDPDETIPSMLVLKHLKHQTLGPKTPRLDIVVPDKLVFFSFFFFFSL
jgi:hypothetical protein